MKLRVQNLKFGILLTLLSLYLFFPQKAFAYEKFLTGYVDTYINLEEFTKHISHGQEPTLLVKRQTSNDFAEITYAYILFSSNPLYITSSEVIRDAFLDLNLVDSSGGSCKISIQRTRYFNENDTAETLPFTSIGPDYDNVAIPNVVGAYSFNITGLVKDWQQGKIEDLAVVLFASGGEDCEKQFASFNFSDYQKKPTIRVVIDVLPTLTYTPTPTIKPSVTPTLTPKATATPLPSPTLRIKTPTPSFSPTFLPSPTLSLLSTITTFLSPTPGIFPKKDEKKSILLIGVISLGIILTVSSFYFLVKLKKKSRIEENYPPMSGSQNKPQDDQSSNPPLAKK